MRIIAIDPGTEQSAIVYLTQRGDAWSVGPCKIAPNSVVGAALMDISPLGDSLAIEMIASYGMSVGSDVFETCVWIGYFRCAWGRDSTKVYRKDVKMSLCGSMKAKDANIRQALIDMAERAGGGKTPQIGTKKQPGPLYGIKSHMWAALAVGVTHAKALGYDVRLV